MGKSCFPVPGTYGSGSREHSLPAPIYKYIPVGNGNGRAPTLMCGAINARPTHGSEPTQTKRAGRNEKRKRRW